jgi:hypothetical protein
LEFFVTLRPPQGHDSYPADRTVSVWEPLGGKPTVKETDNLEDAIGQEDMLASEGRIFTS